MGFVTLEPELIIHTSAIQQTASPEITSTHRFAGLAVPYICAARGHTYTLPPDTACAVIKAARTRRIAGIGVTSGSRHENRQRVLVSTLHNERIGHAITVRKTAGPQRARERIVQASRAFPLEATIRLACTGKLRQILAGLVGQAAGSGARTFDRGAIRAVTLIDSVKAGRVHAVKLRLKLTRAVLKATRSHGRAIRIEARQTLREITGKVHFTSDRILQDAGRIERRATCAHYTQTAFTNLIHAQEYAAGGVLTHVLGKLSAVTIRQAAGSRLGFHTVIAVEQTRRWVTQPVNQWGPPEVRRAQVNARGIDDRVDARPVGQAASLDVREVLAVTVQAGLLISNEHAVQKRAKVNTAALYAPRLFTTVTRARRLQRRAQRPVSLERPP
jgi:hypothetical protein